jgi:hypothetical protein
MLTSDSIEISQAQPEALEAALPGKLGTYGSASSAANTKADKWLLSSALQKLIRRGRAGEAVAIALRLHRLDPTYLLRRLPIIALEDVGVGDLAACWEVVTLCSSARWWRVHAAETIDFAVSALARAVKSRSACDAYCLGDAVAAINPRMAVPIEASREELIEVASDRTGADLITRINALRALGGVSMRRGRFLVPVRRCDLPALDEVGRRLHMPPLILALMKKQSRTASLAAMLPIAVEATADAVIAPAAGWSKALAAVDGVPLCAVDQFSMFGKSVLRRFYRQSKAAPRVELFLTDKKHRDAALNMALFHVESSLLDRRLSSPMLNELTEDTEAAEMRRAGLVAGADRHAFYDQLRLGAPELNAIRIEALLALRDGQGA